MDELAALRYCVEVLEARGKADPARAWLWAIKRKVALYCVRALEGGGGRRHTRLARLRRAVAARLGFREKPPASAEGQRQAEPLTDEEKQLTRRTHPLLQDTRSRSLDAGFLSHCKWYADIRQKVAAFADTWKEHHSRPTGQSC
ncbi:MAG: hypothetical protein FJ290_22420 [Planctomycetes bacterium]|nr:hypothetical protein [Planctomycetota bacterium]